MHIDTGKMISSEELKALPELEQGEYVHLSDAQAKKYSGMTPENRVKQWRNDRICKEKKVKKMRDKTKMSHKMQMERKRK